MNFLHSKGFCLARLALIASIVLLSACEDSPSTAAVETEVPYTTLRFGHEMPVTSSKHQAALRFAAEIKRKSQGSLQIEIFPNQRLGSDRHMLAMTQRGELDIFLSPTAKLSHIIPEMQIIDFPFLFSSAQLAHKTLDGVAGDILLAKLKEHKIIGLGFWESGFKQLTSNKPIVKAEDLKDMNFRIMQSYLIRDQFNAWGAKTQVIDFGKTFEALKDSAVDGEENPLNSIINMGFHEVQAHLTISNHGYLTQVLSMSEMSFNNLSLKHQRVIFDTAREIIPYQRAASQEKLRQALVFLQSHAIQVSSLSPEVAATLKLKSSHLLEKYRMKFGTELVEQILQTIDEDRQYRDDELVIAIDADMSGNSSLSGLAIRRGIELALDEINAKGGVLGKKLLVTARDNSMIPARGLDNLKKFSAIPNLVAVFGGISSPVLLAELAYIHKHKLLLLNPWAAASPIINNGYEPNYVFRVSVSDEYAAEFLLQHALNISTKVGLLLVDNGWGRSSYTALTAKLNEKNLQANRVEWFEWGEEGFTELIQKLYDAGAEVIVFVGNPIEGAKMIQTLSYQYQPIPVVSHWGITGGRFPQLAGEALQQIDLRVLQTFSFIGNHSPKAEAFIKKYQEKYFISSVEEIVAPVGTAHAYDLTHLLAKAIIKANSTDREKIQIALETIKHHSGLIREYQPPFTREHHDALSLDDFILTRYKNGHLVPLDNNDVN